MHTVTSDTLGHAMYDAVVVGGGVAGSTSAVSLAKKGLRVLLCEAGLPSNRRLAGELLHPPATRTLDELGLLPELEAAGAMPAYGFAIFTPEREKPTMLSYSEIRGERSTGIALEHASITHALLTGAKRTPGITVWDDARVLAVAARLHAMHREHVHSQLHFHLLLAVPARLAAHGAGALGRRVH